MISEQSGTLGNDQYLGQLDKIMRSSNPQNTVTVTLKRFVQPPNQKWKPGNKSKNALHDEASKEIDRAYPLMIHYKSQKCKNAGDVKLKGSTEVTSDYGNAFTNSIANIFRLNATPDMGVIKKSIKKPTPKDPNSKRSKKLKERVQQRKLRKLKKKEKALHKTVNMKQKVQKIVPE